MDTWRVIYDGKNTASYNMAADAYLLEMAEKGEAKPFVRLYGWDQPSITIGFHQRLERAVNPLKLGSTPVVRRITGGRALLHDDGELTYAIAGNFSRYPGLGGSLSESYHFISQGIVSFYKALGCPARISHRDESVALPYPGGVQKGCFASVSQFEILIGDQKTAAGSQRRTQTSFLQHGAIKITTPNSHPAIVGPPQVIDNQALRLFIRGGGELRSILIEAFNKIFNVDFAPLPFSELETAAIRRLSTGFENLNRN